MLMTSKFLLFARSLYWCVCSLVPTQNVELFGNAPDAARIGQYDWWNMVKFLFCTGGFCELLRNVRWGRIGLASWFNLGRYVWDTACVVKYSMYYMLSCSESTQKDVTLAGIKHDRDIRIIRILARRVKEMWSLPLLGHLDLCAPAWGHKLVALLWNIFIIF